MRYFIGLAYKGTDFHGWQVQPNAVTVQERVNKGLSMLVKEEICVLGAGRTDAGVHAKQMYAHFDTHQILDCKKIQYRLNSYLCDGIHIKSISAPAKGLYLLSINYPNELLDGNS